MNLPELSIKRPVFITCAFLLSIAVGGLSISKIGVDLFPNVTFPIVFVQTQYAGSSPNEIETLISKPIEDEVSTISGIKSLRSVNKEGQSQVIAEFTLETDIKYAEQQIRDRIAVAKIKLPKEIDEPIVRRIDPSDQPILIIALTADLPPAKLYDLANEVIKPKLEQINQVGLVEVIGGRKREIKVELDAKKLKSHEVSASMVAQRIKAAGQNVPAGKIDQQRTETVFRTLAEFKSPKDIEDTVVNFFGNDVPVSIREVGRVVDSLADEETRGYVNGTKSIFLTLYRQSGSNTIAVAKAAKARIELLNKEIQTTAPGSKLLVVRDTSKVIKNNVTDVEESIAVGILLTILVVFFFLGNIRSTFITGLALPNSLLGAFILMAAFGFTINVMTLLALSLAVGLLIDDAIVVRENIYRHIELGMPPKQAALIGTKEVTLAVIATTLTVVSVFGPIAFISGVVGQFFREFGLTICFIMLISTIDALTMAPMLSAYMAGSKDENTRSLSGRTIGALVRAFHRFQDKLEDLYERVLRFTLKWPILILVSAVVVFATSISIVKYIPKTFLPPQDFGEFSVKLDLPPGANLDAMNEATLKADKILRSHPEVESSVIFVGAGRGAENESTIYVQLVGSKRRKMNTSQFKDLLRQELKEIAYANPRVQDIDMVGGGMRPFNLNISGPDLKQLEDIGSKALAKLKNHPALKDVDISFRPGKPEVQVVFDKEKAKRLGVASEVLGLELRTQIEGVVPALYREDGKEYDVRVRLQDDQRNLKDSFKNTFIPNINGYLVNVADVANLVETTGPANINREDRGRYVQINADLASDGPGLGAAINDINKMFTEGELTLPPGVRYEFKGQAENFKELIGNMLLAGALAIIFIYLVLASLYESFVTPLTIMLVIPLAACGAFFGLLVTGKSLDLFSMIGAIMLLGVATKNSILLVDYANKLIRDGKDRSTALIEAGRTRLRPILMTTVALIAGMLPVAIGLNEASKQRTSMGVAIIGGLITSTLLTLVVVPAAFSYIDRFRIWSLGLFSKLGGDQKPKLRAIDINQEPKHG